MMTDRESLVKDVRRLILSDLFLEVEQIIAKANDSELLALKEALTGELDKKLIARLNEISEAHESETPATPEAPTTEPAQPQSGPPKPKPRESVWD